MHKLFSIIALITFGISLNSCALLFNRNPHLVKIDTYPDSASVFINDTLVGTTPFEKKLSDNIDIFTVSLKKEGFKDNYYLIEKRQNLIYKILDIYLISGYIISAISGYGYMELNPKNTSLFLEPDITNLDGLAKLKSLMKSNILTLNVSPIVSIVGGILGTGVNYYRDLYVLSETNSTMNKLGVKGGWGWGTYGLLSGSGGEGYGYNMLPSYSFEKINYNSMTYSKSIYSLGFSYRRAIDYSPFGYEADEVLEGFTPSFNYQKINYYPSSGLFWGYSLGYVNALNIVSIDFGIRF